VPVFLSVVPTFLSTPSLTVFTNN